MDKQELEEYDIARYQGPDGSRYELDRKYQTRSWRDGRNWFTLLLHKGRDSKSGGILAAFIVLLVVSAIWAPRFATVGNFSVVSESVSQVGIMAVGMTFVIITAEIDLSIGSIYALSGVSAGLALEHGWPIIGAIGLALVVGMLAGAMNGLLTVWLRLPSFIVTLGTLTAYEGAALLLSGGNPISLGTGVHGLSAFNVLGQGQLDGVINVQVVFFVVLLLLGGLLLRYTRFGYHVYAVGGSTEAARLSGININVIKILAFTLSGTVAAVAGILGLSFLDYIEGISGSGIELTVIAAVIIGGVALFGGSGTMTGTLIGVLFLGTLSDILNLKNVSSFVEQIVTGGIIIIAVSVDTLGLVKRRGSGKGKKKLAEEV